MAKASEAKVRVNDVVWRPRLVALPKACPNCGADLSDGITEMSWLNVAVDGSVLAGNFAGGGSTDMGDRYEVRGYECADCHAQVVFGTERWESPGEAPLAATVAAKAQAYAEEAERRGESLWAGRFAELAAALEQGV